MFRHVTVRTVRNSQELYSTLWINMNKVCEMYRFEGLTKIMIEGKEPILVRETPEEILRQEDFSTKTFLKPL